MPSERALGELLRRASKGDEAACAELVRQLEPVIRRAVRVHLPADDPLRRVFDSLDVSQSVLVNFLVKAGAGALCFRGPEELRGLLRMMAAQKFIDKRRSRAARLLAVQYVSSGDRKVHRTEPGIMVIIGREVEPIHGEVA